MSRKSETPAERDARLTREDREDMERRAERHRRATADPEMLEFAMYNAQRDDDWILLRLIELVKEQDQRITKLEEGVQS